MVWKIEWSEGAAKEFRKLDKNIQKEIYNYLIKRVSLTDNPRSIGKSLKKNLSGLWRYRIADHRMVCKIEDEKITIIVLRVAHRRKVYQDY